MEQRSEERFIPHDYRELWVELRQPNAIWRGWVRDISAGGIQVMIPNMPISFLFPGEAVTGNIRGLSSREICLTGRIVWLKEGEPRLDFVLVGVWFDEKLPLPDWFPTIT